MIAEFSITPLDKGAHLSGEVASIVKIVKDSGISYKLNPMGTVIEGSFDEVTDVIKKCHEAAMQNSTRTITSITIDDHKGHMDMMKNKVSSVEARIGEKINV